MSTTHLEQAISACQLMTHVILSIQHQLNQTSDNNHSTDNHCQKINAKDVSGSCFQYHPLPIYNMYSDENRSHQHNTLRIKRLSY